MIHPVIRKKNNTPMIVSHTQNKTYDIVNIDVQLKFSNQQSGLIN